MSKTTDGETKTILKKLSILILLFYIIQYIVCISMAAGMGELQVETAQVNATFAEKYSPGLLPFWHFECGVGQGDIALISWISMVVSQFCLTLLIFKIVASTSHAWDYSVTISFFHFVVSCIATRAFPVSWQWWVTLIVCTLIVSVVSVTHSQKYYASSY